MNHSHYSRTERAPRRRFISYTLFAAVRDEVGARARDVETTEEDDDVALSLGHGQGDRERERERQTDREGEDECGACAKK